MKPFLYAALAGYVVAAIHAVLAFVNKRRAVERIAFYSAVVGFAATGRGHPPGAAVRSLRAAPAGNARGVA